MKVVTYKRVSTRRQGVSGLGLKAQEKSISDYLNGKNHELIGEMVEVESGRKKDRPVLREALKLCKKHKATLICANTSRLARNVHFLTGILESGVEIVFLDMPHANRFTIQIMACVAEEEARRISESTRKALAARAARGLPNGVTGKDRALENKKEADLFAETMLPHLQKIAGEFTAKGVYLSLKKLTDTLNAKGIKPMRSDKWHISTVNKLCKRLDFAYT